MERAVRRVCPSSLAQEAEDLVQESFIRLIKSRKLENPETLSATYLKKVAYSAVIDEIRRRRRRPPASSSVEGELDELSDTSTAPPEESTMGDSLGNALEVCLQRLQDDRRQALTLHLLGYTGAEVAHMLGCNAKRAENLTLRGLTQLRQHLADMGLWP